MKNIVLIIGGNNEEANLSIHSARFVYEILQEHAHMKIVLLKDNNTYFSVKKDYIYSNTIDDFIDFVHEKVSLDNINADLFIPLIHGIEGEGGQLQEQLDKYKIPYMFSSGEATKKMFFKNIAMDILKKNGFNQNFISVYEKIPHYSKPIIVKPNSKGSSVGVKYIKTITDINFSLNNTIIEEHIEGMEFSAVVIDGKCQGVIEIQYPTEFLSYKQKYFPDDNVKIIPLNNKQIEKDTEEIYKIFNARDIIRIDGFIRNNGNIVYTDLNPIPSLDFNSFTWICCKKYSGEIFLDLVKKYLPIHNDKINRNVNKTDLPIIFGGNSPENNISLLSGLNVFIKLKRSQKYNPIPVLLYNEELYLVPQNSMLLHNVNNVKIYTTTPLCKISHIPYKKVFLALHGGMGEDGTIQAILEQKNIVFNGPNSKLCKLFINKMDTINFIKKLNIDNIIIQPQFTQYQSGKMIMKPVASGSSMNVYVVDNLSQVNNIYALHPKENFFFEHYVENAVEMTVVIYQGKCLVPSLCKKETILSCEDKFLNGWGTNITPALDDKNKIEYIQSIFNKLVKKLNINSYCRIDFFFFPKENKIMIIEINALPALTMSTVLFHQLSYENIDNILFLESLVEKNSVV